MARLPTLLWARRYDVFAPIVVLQDVVVVIYPCEYHSDSAKCRRYDANLSLSVAFQPFQHAYLILDNYYLVSQEPSRQAIVRVYKVVLGYHLDRLLRHDLRSLPNSRHKLAQTVRFTIPQCAVTRRPATVLVASAFCVEDQTHFGSSVHLWHSEGSTIACRF
jgi:hypothetical protein